jgi:AraC-like DNA-binding protein
MTPGATGRGQPGPDQFIDALRRVLRAHLLTGSCSVDEVAGHFHMHRRTLSRHLKARGTGFHRIVEEERFEIACRLLANPRVTFGHIATTLGFSEASAFTRAFRRWSGQTPTAWRAGHPPVGGIG